MAKSVSTTKKAGKATKNVTKSVRVRSAKAEDTAASKPASAPAAISFTLTRAARDFFGEVEFVRLKKANGLFHVRPTNRTKGISNLPKGEMVLPLTRTANGIRFSVEMEVENGATFRLDPSKYGWYDAVPTTEVVRDAAILKASSR